MSNRNHYQNLGLSQDAKPEAIQAAHAALIEKCRAELSPNADASRFLNAIDTALAVLSDPIQRAAYDQQLLGSPQGAATPFKAPTANKSQPTTGDSRPKVANSIASEVASKVATPPMRADSPQRRKGFAMAWPIGLVAAIGLAWFAYAKLTSNANQELATGAAALPTSEQAVLDTKATANPIGAPASSDNNVNQLTELSYDAASIDQFIGAWQGQGGSSMRQTLDINLKSSDSLVFSLKTKSGNNIGDLVGVAVFENGLARFVNAEYGCQLLITRSGQQLNVNTSGCQAFYQKGAEFDGAYVKPESIKVAQSESKAPIKSNRRAVQAEPTVPAAAPIQAPALPSTSAVKLSRYIATVKDAEGKTQRIELVAADEAAARAILRDFRGNPKVIRIRKAWF